MARSEDFRGEVVDFEVKVKYDFFPGVGEIDYTYITLVYKDGRKIKFTGGDHGNEDPWVNVRVS